MGKVAMQRRGAGNFRVLMHRAILSLFSTIVSESIAENIVNLDPAVKS